MKKLILSILFTATLISASSQKVYFIYIQTESEQPFFIKIDEKIHSSTSTGYLILSKLIDSSYNLSIGFPQNKWPEQKFSVEINKKDHGFILKHFGEKGWGLFNLQTLAIQMASNAVSKTSIPSKTENNAVSKFTEILSRAADDPSLKEKPAKPVIVEKRSEVVQEKAEKKDEEIVVEKAKINTKPIKTEEPAPEKIMTSIVEEEPVINEEKEKPKPILEKIAVEEKKPEEETTKTSTPADQSKEEKKISGEVEPETSKSSYESYNASQVKKWSESSTTEGFGLVYIDYNNNGMEDTIRLLIPNPKHIEVPVTAKGDLKEEKRFIDIGNKEENKKEETKLIEVKSELAEVTSPNQILSNNCTLIAEEGDFLTLRKLMAAKGSDEEMIIEAKKYFKIRCFTSEQIKNLGSLFLIDESKYNFFDVAYGYVSDAKEFAVLQNELKDEYYINRFRAMLRN